MKPEDSEIIGEGLPRPVFNSLQEYGDAFTREDYWRPYLERILTRHGLSNDEPLKTGIPGTHPVFLSDTWVVKLYEPFFDGGPSWRIEKECYERFESEAAISAPRVLASGRLFDGSFDESWPYLLLSRIPGRSIGEDLDRMTLEDRETMFRYLGETIGTIHSLPVRDFIAAREERGSFRDYLDTLRRDCIERHRKWGALPERLIRQIPDYLPPLDALLGEESAFLHADLTEDHLFGEFADGSWRPTGLIDFGDARIGDPAFEWVPLHFDLFRCDPKAFRFFMNSYSGGSGFRPINTKRLMSYALLFEFDLFSFGYECRPELKDAEDLDALERLIWKSAQE